MKILKKRPNFRHYDLYTPKILCQIPTLPKNTEVFIDGLVFYDNAGTLIPITQLTFDILYADEGKKASLQINTERKLGQIIEQKTIESISTLKDFIYSWILTADYIADKQKPKILYSQQADTDNSIYLSCQVNCPEYRLFDQDQAKYEQLCKDLDNVYKIEGMIFDSYFSALHSSCEKRAEQRENEEAFEEQDTSKVQQETSQDSDANPTVWKDSLRIGEVLEVGSKLVNGNWSMVLTENSIRIESDADDYLHELIIGSYSSIEIIKNEIGYFVLVANTDNDGQIEISPAYSRLSPAGAGVVEENIYLQISRDGAIWMRIQNTTGNYDSGKIHNIKYGPIWELPSN